MPMLLPTRSVSSSESTAAAVPAVVEHNLFQWGNEDDGGYHSSDRRRSVTAVDGSPPPAAHVPISNAQNSEVDRAAAVLSSLSSMPGAASTLHEDHEDSDEADSGREAGLSVVDEGDGAKRHLVEMLAQEDIEDRVMQRGVRIVYVGQEYSNVHYLIRQRARRASASVNHFPSNQISRKYTSHELDRIPREAFELPPRAVADVLLAAYFRHVHRGFPVLDKAVFMGQYHRRDPHNPLSLLVLQAVLMVGAHVYRDDGGVNEGSTDAEADADARQTLLSNRAALKADFFRRAKMLFDARFEWNRDVVVQAALLMMWHSEGVEDIGANSYYWVGVAARTALGLGMHRDTRSSTLIAQDKRLWRRLWWILVQFDVLVSLSYGRPQAVNIAESDVPELTPEELTEMDIIENGDASGVDNGIDSDFLIHQTHLCRIISDTLRDRFGLQVPLEDRRQALAAADQRLAVWMAQLPSSLRCRPDIQATSPWATMLHLTYNNFLILLHRPPPTPVSFVNITSQEDMGICSAAAGTTVGLFEAVSFHDELRFLNVFAVDALFTTLIQLSAEIRMANPILAGHAVQRFDSAMGILRRLAGIWLNAEIILRLFEDSSERTRSELLIGKSGTRNNTSSIAANLAVGPSSENRATRRPEEAADMCSASNGLGQVHSFTAITPGSAGFPMEGLQSLILTPSTSVQEHHLVPLNEQLGWTSLYWENSGFTSLSPFTDFPMYL